MRRIFISHKRKNGQASPEAILIKNHLDKQHFYKSFMDVREEYVGEFPKTLVNQINGCDVFIFIIPSDLNLDFLQDRDNWVYKEIKHALYLNECCNKRIKILPISFTKEFVWNKDLDYGDIKSLLNYNILYYDLNQVYSSKSLIRSIGFPKSKYWLPITFLLIFVLLVLFFGKIWIDDKTIQPETKELILGASKYNSLSSYSKNSKEFLNPYLSWYAKIADNKDLSVNKEFNETYLKYAVLKTLVLSYIGFSIGDLEKEQDADYINKLINDCYSNIPEESKNVYSYNGEDIPKRTEIFTSFLDNAITYLQNRTDIKSMPTEFIPLLRQQCLNSLRVNSDNKTNE